MASSVRAKPTTRSRLTGLSAWYRRPISLGQDSRAINALICCLIIFVTTVTKGPNGEHGQRWKLPYGIFKRNASVCRWLNYLAAVCVMIYLVIIPALVLVVMRLQLWQDDPAACRSLLDDGYRMAKVWPFDRFSEQSLGQQISIQDCEAGIATIAAMREVDNGALGVGLEGHSRWALPAGRRIAEACEQYQVEFLEDLLPAHDVAALATVASDVDSVVGSETIFTLYTLRELITSGAVDIVMLPHVVWRQLRPRPVPNWPPALACRWCCITWAARWRMLRLARSQLQFLTCGRLKPVGP